MVSLNYRGNLDILVPNWRNQGIYNFLGHNRLTIPIHQDINGALFLKEVSESTVSIGWQSFDANIPELTRGKKVVGPLFDIRDGDVEPRHDDAALV